MFCNLFCSTVCYAFHLFTYLLYLGSESLLKLLFSDHVQDVGTTCSLYACLCVQTGVSSCSDAVLHNCT